MLIQADGGGGNDSRKWAWKVALQRLAVTPPEALYVGDMTVDIDTARAAGVAVWVVPTGSDGIPTGEPVHARMAGHAVRCCAQRHSGEPIGGCREGPPDAA